MKNLILILILTGCTQQQLETQSRTEDVVEAQFESSKPCDQAALDKHSAEIGAYEITCEELEAL
jgi:PBP1b-binding outer membrane lipoprotein LpoB